MGVHSFGLYGADGRMHGCYVYLLFCPIDEAFFVKVGMAKSPTKRLDGLRTGCPVDPKVMAVVELASRGLAISLERTLHHQLSKWRTHGEWFRIPNDEKKRFSDIANGSLNAFKQPAWPLAWTQVPLKTIIAEAARRRRYGQMKFASRGKAYRDFVRHLKS